MISRSKFAWLALGLSAGAIAWVRLADPFGDRGMANVVTGLGLVVLGLAGLTTFLLRRTLALGLRLRVLSALLALGALFFLFLRPQGVSGEMIPRFGWRFGARTTPVPTPVGRPEGLALAAPASTDFPGFLGARRDNSVPAVRLARDWDARAPRQLWRQAIGPGWSAFAVAGGWAFTLEQDERGQRVSARSVASGALGWSVALDEPFAHVLGGDGPRSTPTVELAPEGGRVYAQSAWGRLVCLEARSGALLWQHDLAREHGLTRAQELELAQYGRSSSPLVTAELVILPAGGDPAANQAGLVAFDKRTGARRWASPPRHFSYSSPALATLLGTEQVVIVNEASLSGHALTDGRLLWEHPWPGRTSGDANVSQAVPLAPDRVFVSKGYGGGGLLLALEPLVPGETGGFRTRELWHAPRILRTKLTNVVVQAGCIYGLDDGMLECVELATGRRVWKEGRYGHGQILLVGALLLLCSEAGQVFVLDPSPERPNAVLASFQALEGKCWAHLALAGSVLLLRNAEECAAWELPTEG